MNKLSQYGIWFPILLVMLAACAAPTDTAPTPTVPPTAAPASTRVASPTPTLKSTPTLTPTVTASVVLPTPVLPELFDNDFLFGSVAPECELPCWQGLYIGSSGQKEIETLFNTQFGFDGSFELGSYEFAPYEVEGLYAAGHTWLISSSPREYFSTIAWVNEDMYVLEGLEFRWAYRPVQANMTPQRIFQQLGVPEFAYASFQATEKVDIYGLDMLIAYENGLVMDLATTVPATIVSSSPGVIDQAIVEFCFDQEVSGGVTYIVEEFSAGLNNLSAMQARVTQREIDLRGHESIEALFEMSLEDITAASLNNVNPCIYVDLYE